MFPGIVAGLHLEIGFSPRARGCSLLHKPDTDEHEVFPACAGMFPETKTTEKDKTGFPRVRGDVPAGNPTQPPQTVFSPRARGCSEHQGHEDPGVFVFPACAGMFRGQATGAMTLVGFPRVRGDVPPVSSSQKRSSSFSPRARGCSSELTYFRWSWRVFPACAGMFLNNFYHVLLPKSFPRVRGDVPISAT